MPSPLILVASPAAPLLLDDVRVVDARGDLGVHDLLLQDGRIVAWDPVEAPADATRVDGAGHTVVPGLIDAHVHISQRPGAAFLEAEADGTAALAERLASTLAWGVTTVVDPGITAEDARAARSRAEVGPSPRLVFVGPLVGPVHGYPSAVIPELAGVAGPDELGAMLDDFEDLGAPGLKLTVEDGPMQRVWPLLEPALLEEVQRQARARQLGLWVHAMDPDATRRALRLQPEVLVHAPQGGGRRLARRIAESGATVVTTLDILDGESWHRDRERLDPESLARTVAPDALGAVFDPAIRRAMFEKGLDIYAPALGGVLRGPALRALERGRLAERRTRRAGRFLRLLQQAGVPLVVGSDAGGSPIVPWLLHGPATHLELAALVRAGLSPLEALTAATLEPARLLGLEGELGLVEPGLVADLVVVDGDPLADLAVLQRPVLVIRGGEARTPEQWIAAAHP